MELDSTILVEDAETIAEESPYSELVDRIEAVFSAYDYGKVEMPEKSYVQIREHNGDFRSMPAYVNTDDWEASSLKWVNVHPKNEELPTVMAVVVYNDPETGFPLAVMNGTEITARRTGASAAVATKHLAKKNPDRLGILGAGAQSYEQVDAISEVRDFDKILVSDIDEERVEDFINHYNGRFDVVSATPEEVASCDILSTVTPVTEPIIKQVGDNIHINAMGADAPSKQEFDKSIITSSDVSVIVDDIEQTVHSGEISKSVESGKFTKTDIDATLGGVINDGFETEGPTLFDSTGLAIQDTGTAHQIFESIDPEEFREANFVPR